MTKTNNISSVSSRQSCKDLYVFDLCNFIFKKKENHISIKDNHKLNTRQSNNIYIPHKRYGIGITSMY